MESKEPRMCGVMVCGQVHARLREIDVPAMHSPSGLFHQRNNIWDRVWENKDPQAGCRGWQGDVPVAAPPPRDVPELMEQNIGEGWFPAHDPAASPLALLEVRQAAMPSKCRRANRDR